MSIIVLLYIFTVLHLATQWVFTRDIFIIHGDTADDAANETFGGAVWWNMLASTAHTTATILADGILVSTSPIAVRADADHVHIEGLEMLDHLGQEL